jgi:hypothetical protein
MNLAYRTFGEFLECLRHDGIEDADELLQVDLAVVVGVPQGEQGVDLLAVEVLRGAHLVPADLTVPVRVDQSKGGLDKDKLNLAQPVFFVGKNTRNTRTAKSVFSTLKRQKYCTIHVNYQKYTVCFYKHIFAFINICSPL